MTRKRLLNVADGKVVEGWEVDYFLEKALGKKTYPDLRSVMSDLEVWLDHQG
jgi:hypothetical protein